MREKEQPPLTAAPLHGRGMDHGFGNPPPVEGWPKAGNRVTVTATPDAGYEENCPPDAFSDAEKTAWYHDGVRWALENGVMSGMGEGLFAPNGATSRAMLAQILYNLEGKPAYGGPIDFTDVNDADWYAAAITWASAQCRARARDRLARREDGLCCAVYGNTSPYVFCRERRPRRSENAEHAT